MQTIIVNTYPEVAQCHVRVSLLKKAFHAYPVMFLLFLLLHLSRMGIMLQ